MGLNQNKSRRDLLHHSQFPIPNSQFIVSPFAFKAKTALRIEQISKKGLYKCAPFHYDIIMK